MEPITIITCTKCGSTDIRKEGVDAGYSSADSLNRPAGAKGRDEYVTVRTCAKCGCTVLGERPAPCHICGKEGKEGMRATDLCQLVTEGALFEHIPGLPVYFNLCGDPKCFTEVEKLGKRLLDKAFSEGYFDE